MFLLRPVVFLTIFLAVTPSIFGRNLKVCFSTLPPWKMVVGDKFEGPGAEIVKEIGKKLKTDVEFVHVPFKRGLYFLKYGEFDLMTGLLKTDERNEYIRYIEPAYKRKSNKVFYQLVSSRKDIKKYEDLKTLHIGTQFGAKYFRRFDSDTGLKKHPVYKIKQNIFMLLSNRIDTFVGTDSAVDFQLKTLGFDGRIKKSQFGFFKINPVYIGISRKSYFNRKKYISIISGMIKRGEIKRIIDRFFVKRGIPIPDYY